jgi:YidC/Oxa1 family membrane protein insertase
MSMHVLFGTSWLDPIVSALWLMLSAIDAPLKNYGWSLVVLAAVIRLIFWPFNTLQFKAFLNMQKIAPQIKKLQARYKDDQQKLQQETLALYRENKVNPFAGCWPMLIQYPVIISVYYVVLNHRPTFETQKWLWVGSTMAAAASKITVFGQAVLAQSLAHADFLLIVLYAFSMYLSVRYVSMPATDPQQAQTQRMMAVVSPLMLGFFGWRYQWPSAMVLYWFAYNIFTMGQQFYLLRRYHQPLALIDSEHVITEDALPSSGQAGSAASSTGPSRNGAKGGGRSGRRSKRKNKKGAYCFTKTILNSKNNLRTFATVRFPGRTTPAAASAGPMKARIRGGAPAVATVAELRAVGTTFRSKLSRPSSCYARSSRAWESARSTSSTSRAPKASTSR